MFNRDIGRIEINTKQISASNQCRGIALEIQNKKRYEIKHYSYIDIELINSCCAHQNALKTNLPTIDCMRHSNL